MPHTQQTHLSGREFSAILEGPITLERGEHTGQILIQTIIGTFFVAGDQIIEAVSEVR